MKRVRWTLPRTAFFRKLLLPGWGNLRWPLQNNRVCITLSPWQLYSESRYLWGSNLKTVVGGRRLSFNREKCVSSKAFYSTLQQSCLFSSYPAWCWKCSPKLMICSKENFTKLPKNCKILTELVVRGQGEGSGFLILLGSLTCHEMVLVILTVNLCS